MKYFVYKYYLDKMLTKLERVVRNSSAVLNRCIFRSPDVGGAQCGVVSRGTKDGISSGAYREATGAVAS